MRRLLLRLAAIAAAGCLAPLVAAQAAPASAPARVIVAFKSEAALDKAASPAVALQRRADDLGARTGHP
jgi:hypothetical protein